MAIDFAKLVAAEGIPIRLIDERLTSKTAQQIAQTTAGKNAKQQKAIIDASAACLILEFALASERKR